MSQLSTQPKTVPPPQDPIIGQLNEQCARLGAQIGSLGVISDRLSGPRAEQTEEPTTEANGTIELFERLVAQFKGRLNSLEELVARLHDAMSELGGHDG